MHVAERPPMPLDSHEVDADLINYSEQIATTVAVAAHEMRQAMPEYLGVTMFGSTVRGEAGPNSDADIFVFVMPTDRPGSPQANPRLGSEAVVFPMQEDGRHVGSHPFHSAVEVDYKMEVLDALHRAGVPNAVKADIDVVPLSDDIVTEEINNLLDIVSCNDPNELKAITARMKAFRNIRGLFHAPVDSADLQIYQQLAISIMSGSEHGEAAWGMIRRKVIGAEAGRNDNETQAPWRTIPENLEDAAQLYGARDN